MNSDEKNSTVTATSRLPVPHGRQACATAELKTQFSPASRYVPIGVNDEIRVARDIDRVSPDVALDPHTR